MMIPTQSLSVVVPAKGCINRCKFCVACMRSNVTEDGRPLYENQIGSQNLYSDLYIKDYIKRLDYARSNGCNVLMLTGNAEPQQNFYFLEKFGMMNSMARQPFENIEIQTTGCGLNRDWLYFLRHTVGVSLVSLSISSFNDKENNDIIGTKSTLSLMGNKRDTGYISLKKLCYDIKTYRMNLRLSINLTKCFEDYEPEAIFRIAKDRFWADQITFRVLYKSTEDPDKMTPQDKWIEENSLSDEKIREITQYVKENGTFERRLEFGQDVMFIHGMSTVIDDDCMDSKKRIDDESHDRHKALKYMILREDAKLYTSWDKPIPHF